MDRQVTQSGNPVRRRTLALGSLAIFAGGVSIFVALGSLPPTLDLLQDQSRWGQGYRFSFQVVDGQCVPVEHTGKPFERDVGAVYSVENFGAPISEGPPFLGWLWAPRIVGLAVETRQTIVWPEQAGEPLPLDLAEQLGVLVEAAIASGRDGFGDLDGLRDELAREMCLPVEVTASSGEVYIPRPMLSYPVPRARLAGVTASALLGVILIAVGALLVAQFILEPVRTSRRRREGRCYSCGYQMTDGSICPECGQA